MDRKTLGILVTSEKHGIHLHALSQAAARKKIALSIHVDGSAVRLCLQKKYQSVWAQAELTICHQSTERFGILDQIETRYLHALTSETRPPLNLNQCARQLVL